MMPQYDLEIIFIKKKIFLSVTCDPIDRCRHTNVKLGEVDTFFCDISAIMSMSSGKMNVHRGARIRVAVSLIRIYWFILLNSGEFVTIIRSIFLYSRRGVYLCRKGYINHLFAQEY